VFRALPYQLPHHSVGSHAVQHGIGQLCLEGNFSFEILDVVTFIFHAGKLRHGLLQKLAHWGTGVSVKAIRRETVTGRLLAQSMLEDELAHDGDIERRALAKKGLLGVFAPRAVNILAARRSRDPCAIIRGHGQSSLLPAPCSLLPAPCTTTTGSEANGLWQ
jgi:hypothetical protein